MTTLENTSPLSLAANPGQLLLNTQVTTEIRKHWEEGEYPNLAALLKEHPEIKPYRSFVLDLAHEEYCRRLANGNLLMQRSMQGNFQAIRSPYIF